MPAKLEKVKIINEKVCLTTAELAAVFAVSAQAIGQWKMEGMPVAASNYYPLADCMRWYEKSSHFQTRANALTVEMQAIGKPLMSDSQRKIKAEAELKALQAEAQDIKNSFSRGDYLLRTEVVKTLSLFFSKLKRSFNSFGRTTSMYVSPFVDDNTTRKIEADYKLMTDDFLRHISEGTNYNTPKKMRKFSRGN